MDQEISNKWQPKKGKEKSTRIRPNFKNDKKTWRSNYTIIKRSIHQEVITIVSIYALNIRAPGQRREINSNTIIVGNLILYSQKWIDCTDREPINNSKFEHYKINKANRFIQTFYPIMAEYTFFSNPQGKIVY